MDMGIGWLIHSRTWTPIRGLYLYPLRCFCPERPQIPEEYLRIIRSVSVSKISVNVTLGGGLIVAEPDDLCGSRSTMAFQTQICDAFNILICELTLHGFVSEPAAPVHVQAGKQVGCHAVLLVGGGYLNMPERHIGVSSLLDAEKGDVWYPFNAWWLPYDASILDRVVRQPLALKLHTISPQLPSLVSAAYYHFARDQFSQAVITSWVVVESILYGWWETFKNSTYDSKRRARLGDARTYTASVQTEVLLVASAISEDLYRDIQRARRHRNDMVHRSHSSRKAAADCMDAMKSAIEHLCGAEVASPINYHGFGALGKPMRS